MRRSLLASEATTAKTSVATSHRPSTTDTSTLTSSSRTDTDTLTTTFEPTTSQTGTTRISGSTNQLKSPSGKQRSVVSLSSPSSKTGSKKKSVKTPLKKSEQRSASSKQSLGTAGKKPTGKRKSGPKSSTSKQSIGTAGKGTSGKRKSGPKSSTSKQSIGTAGKGRSGKRKSGPEASTSKQSIGTAGKGTSGKRKSVPKSSTSKQSIGTAGKGTSGKRKSGPKASTSKQSIGTAGKGTSGKRKSGPEASTSKQSVGTAGKGTSRKRKSGPKSSTSKQSIGTAGKGKSGKRKSGPKSSTSKQSIGTAGKGTSRKRKSGPKPSTSKQSVGTTGEKTAKKGKPRSKSASSKQSIGTSGKGLTGKKKTGLKSSTSKISTATAGKKSTAKKKSRQKSVTSKKSITTTGKQPATKKKSKAKLGTASSRQSKKSGVSTKKKSRKSGKRSATSKKSVASQKSAKSKKSKDGPKSKKGKGKVKVKKLNRKAVYKAIKLVEKKMIEQDKRKKKLDWEKNKIIFYWNCTVGKLEDLNKRNCHLKKKKESIDLEKNHALFHEYWRKMNQTRMEREGALDGKRGEFRSMIVQLKESQKRQTDALFKGIQNFVRDTYLVGEKYMADVIGIRMDYTKWMTETLFASREQTRILEIEQNAKYSPALEAFDAEMRRLRSRIPKERQERLQQFLSESNAMLVELVGVYTNILHHNFNEICHTANIINRLKTRERRLIRERDDSLKRLNKVKERTDHLRERISNLRRQVNVGREGRKKLMRVMRDQAFLHKRNDIAYINRELTYQEYANLTEEVQNMSDRVDKWYFQVKRNFLKKVIVEAEIFKERALQLTNYNRLAKHLFDVEDGFLEAVETFKDHEEIENPKEGLKVLLGSFKPFTLEDLEKDFEGCTESFATAIIFFKRRLHQNYLSLDDLHFFIKRRNPLSYLGVSRREQKQLLNELSYAKRGKLSVGSVFTTSNISTVSFRL